MNVFGGDVKDVLDGLSLSLNALPHRAPWSTVAVFHFMMSIKYVSVCFVCYNKMTENLEWVL